MARGEIFENLRNFEVDGQSWIMTLARIAVTALAGAYGARVVLAAPTPETQTPPEIAEI